jgi:DNA-binding transcriptional MerR regulator
MPMFKIGEFSRLTQVSIRMLRYYDETGLLKPAQIDKFSGYRLYSIDQIPMLNRIIFLRDIGSSVAEIAIALSHWDNTSITNQLEIKRLEIENAIPTEQNKLYKINMAIRDINQEKISIHYNVTIKNIPSYQVLSLRKIIPDYYAEGFLWKEMSDFARCFLRY